MEDLNNKKVLIIRLSALGDTIHTLPLANALKKEYPVVRLDWIVEDKASTFIKNNPLIDKMYEIPKSKFRKEKNPIKKLCEFMSIIKDIRKEKYDIVLDTQQLLKSGIILGLSGGKRKITLDDGREFSFLFANEIIKTGRKQFDINYHVVKRNLEFAKYLGVKDLKEEFVIPDFSGKYSENVLAVLEKIDKTKKTILIAPATTWDNKHWTIENWVEILNEFSPYCNILITATEKEKELINKIMTLTDNSNIINLAGKTSLKDMVLLAKNVDVVISPDSGSAHVAWCSGAKSIVTLFFATSARRTAPYGKNYYSISSSANCSPCMKKKCSQNEKNHCINGINAKEVINIVKNVLQ